MVIELVLLIYVSKKYLDRLYACKDVISLALKKQLIYVLSYFGKKSIQLRSCTVKIVNNSLGCCELKVGFRSPCKLNNLFHFKDTLQRKVCSFLVYRCTGSNCNVPYYGKTYSHFVTKAAGQTGISNLTEKKIKNIKQSAVSDHLFKCDCSF